VKLCQHHWDKLVETIQADGLGDLIPPGPLEFARRFHSRKTDGIKTTNFDPVSLAADIITVWAVNGIGQDDLIYVARECPICYFDMPQWIEKASHDSGELWKTLSAGNAQALCSV